ncbi:MAG: N-acetyl-gamma-glutamyl-phosphate reductase [Oscillospiraceae bacterium]|nr:N-acetyl-gamma-glutamyl-phosphate reductase [Oscillospiraceae bacterium]
MAKVKIYVDGQEGTTGLEINDRLKKREDLEILKIAQDKLFDVEERRKYINRADIVFLCLPDEVAIESVSLIDGDNLSTRVIDASTAHRTADGWVYGLPELSPEHRKNIADAKRLANPGCFPTGFNALVYPLVRENILPPDYPVTCCAVTGYSGGGINLINIFESEENKGKLNSPCFYSLPMRHKHLPEMQKHSGLLNPPVFTPIIGGFYRGMTVAVPLRTDAFKSKINAAEINAFYKNYYNKQNFIKIAPTNVQDEFEWGFMNAESCNNTNNLEILVFGHDDCVLLAARLDNLGKGASGAAVQNMNIMLGIDETYGII